MKESAFQARMVRKLRDSGACVLNLIPDERMGKNWPDIYVAHRVWTGWIELKSGTRRRVTTGQMQMIQRLNDRDVEACVLRLMPDGETIQQETDEWAGEVLTLSEMMGENGGAALLRCLSGL